VAVATVASFAAGAPVALAITVTPVSSDGAGATALAKTIVADQSTLTSASFASVPPSGTPNGTADSLSFFPTNGSSFGILTSGDVSLADDPNTSEFSGADDGGSSVRGTSDLDVSILKVDLAVPANVNCMSVDFAFYSDEYPEYVGTGYNDAFIAELDDSTWTTSGSAISAPDNFAFDPSNSVISINSTGATAMTAANAAGTTYDGATPLLRARHTITPGAHTLYLSIFDQGDNFYDSAAFVDNVRFGIVDNASTDCQEGALPPATKPTSTTYDGASSVQYSDAATLSGTLKDTSVSPAVGVAGKQLDFEMGTQSTSGGPTDANGAASNSLAVTQTPGSVSTVKASFAGDSGYDASSDTKSFSITKEDCTLTYSGDTLVGAATSTTLAADLGELDSSLGDRSNKPVTFTVTDAAANVQTFPVMTNAAGHASTTQALGSNVYGVTVSFSGDAYYKACGTLTDTLVTVQAAGSKVTGGGWISIATGKTSFGFNAIPEAGGLFKGQFQLRSNNGKNRFHANVVTTLTGTANTAKWSGTGSWNGTSGYTYTISVVDNGSSGAKKGDTITITIKKTSTNDVVYSSSGTQTLKGGNITVH
jgi:hypothetical protein